MPKNSAEAIRDYFREVKRQNPDTKFAAMLYEDIELMLKLLRQGNTAQAIQVLELRERTLMLQLQDLSP